ncbi:MAG TPA: diaminopropionate ammonia-lyase [Nocardioidaceae bacterium]|nr:diaminopropionate ammonia-lyase [Nocardioidaceae bacterium]
MARGDTAVDAQWYARPQARSWRCEAPPAEPEWFHRSMPGYRPTPLVDYPPLASELGVGRVFVKDESSRLGLPAFKMLGASWAVCRAIGALAPASRAPETLDALRAVRSRLGPLTLVTATDGNHGRAVARMANLLDTDAQIFVPDVVDPAAVELIRAEGAEVSVLAEPYDTTVRRAAEFATGQELTILVQDTSWVGYEEIPQWIVDGYSTLFREVDAQLERRSALPAGLVAVPTGVGSLAQAAVTFHRSSRHQPAALLAVEPDSAACVTASLQRGEPVSVETGNTSMAGLNCGTPSSIAWPYLQQGIDAAVSVTDDQAAVAAHDLARGGVVAGPCGAATLAALRTALLGRDGDLHREQLGLTPDSTVVLLSTEGAPPGDGTAA